MVEEKKAADSSHSETKKWKPGWLTFGTVVAAFTLVLTLLGYGWTAGSLSPFGLRAHDLQRTPLDFLLASEQVVVLYLKFAASASRNPPWHVLFDLWSASGIYALGAGCGVFFLTLAWVRRSSIASAWDRYAAATFRRTRIPHVVSHVRSSLAQKGRAAYWGSAAIVGALYVIAVPLALAVVWAVIAVFSVLIAAIPLQPAVMAERHTHAAVIAPAACRSLKGEQLNRQGAHCVKVVKDACEVARGRLIDGNEKRIWLFTKKPERVTSVPLDGSVVEDVSESPRVQ